MAAVTGNILGSKILRALDKDPTLVKSFDIHFAIGAAVVLEAVEIVSSEKGDEIIEIMKTYRLEEITDGNENSEA